MSSSSWRSSVEKMKRWVAAVGSERRLFCVVHEVPRPQGRSDYADVLVRRIHDSIYRSGYVVIYLKDFYILEMMYGVDWNEMHKVIFQHKKKNAYVLLYSGDLPSDATYALKDNNFGTMISQLVDIYYDHRFIGNTDVNILTIKGVKTNGQHLRCDFVDVHHAELVLNSYRMYDGTGGNTLRVESYPDEV